MKRFSLPAIVCVAMMSAFLARSASAQRLAQPGVQSPHKSEGKAALAYLLYLPKDYGKEKDKKWPLVMFLHGSGERGDNVQKVAIHGPPKLAATTKDFPFILVSPQCPANSHWRPADLSALLDEVSGKYGIDADRLYLTGLSLGGFGTFATAIAYPDKFAAIAPVCGGGNPEQANEIKDVPTWVFHGDADTAVSVEKSKDMVEAMKAAGAPEAKLTIYPGVGHDSWTQTYNDPKLYEWLLSHKRGAKAAGDKSAK